MNKEEEQKEVTPKPLTFVSFEFKKTDGKSGFGQCCFPFKIKTFDDVERAIKELQTCSQILGAGIVILNWKDLE